MPPFLLEKDWWLLDPGSFSLLRSSKLPKDPFLNTDTRTELGDSTGRDAPATRPSKLGRIFIIIPLDDKILLDSLSFELEGEVPETETASLLTSG